MATEDSKFDGVMWACIAVTDVKPLVTGSFDVEYVDLETKRPGSMVITPGVGCYVFAPGFCFYIRYTKIAGGVKVTQQWSYRTSEECLRKNHREAIHGYGLEEIATAPKNTFVYFVPVTQASSHKPAHKPHRVRAGL